MTREMPEIRDIDGIRHCLTSESQHQAVYQPCPTEPAAAAVGATGLFSVAVVGLIWVVWLAPAIAARRTMLNWVINDAERSLR